MVRDNFFSRDACDGRGLLVRAAWSCVLVLSLAMAGAMTAQADPTLRIQAGGVGAEGAAIDGWRADLSAAEAPGDDAAALLERGLAADQSGDTARAQRLFEQVIAKVFIPTGCTVRSDIRMGKNILFNSDVGLLWIFVKKLEAGETMNTEFTVIPTANASSTLTFSASGSAKYRDEVSFFEVTNWTNNIVYYLR